MGGPVGLLEPFDSNQLAQQVFHSLSRGSLAGQFLLYTTYKPHVIAFQTRVNSWMTPELELMLRNADGPIPSDASMLSGAVQRTTQRETFRDGVLIERRTIVTVEEFSGLIASTQETIQQFDHTRTQTSKKTQTFAESVNENESQNVFFDEVGGTIQTTEARIFTGDPFTTENVPQPVVLRTLDGRAHRQFLTIANPDFFGGNDRGTTQTIRTTTAFGDPVNITTRTREVVTLPTGERRDTTTELITPRLAGTALVRTPTGFQTVVQGLTTTTRRRIKQGLQENIEEVTTDPLGVVKRTTTTRGPVGGQQTDVFTDDLTNEDGQRIITTRNVVTDPVTGNATETTTRQFKTATNVVIKTVTTTSIATVPDSRGGQPIIPVDPRTGQKVDDNIIGKKVETRFVREHVLQCIMEEGMMQFFYDVYSQHQVGHAAKDNIETQLNSGVLTLQRKCQLIKARRQAIRMLQTVPLNIIGQQFSVVFAPSASAFVSNLIFVEPHIYSVQCILHEITDVSDIGL